MSGRMFNIFYEHELSGYLEARKQNVIKTINETTSMEHLVNRDRKEWADSLISSFEIKQLVIDFDNKYATDRMEEIEARLFPRDFNVFSGKRYPKQIITYHIPYIGDENLLHCIPSSRILRSELVYLQGEEIRFDIINFYDKPDQIAQRADEIINVIKQQLNNVIEEVAQYNAELPKYIIELIEAKNSQIMKQNNILSSLGIPVRKSFDHKAESIGKTNTSEPKIKPQIYKKERVDTHYDVFICHASEDKESIANLLAKKLRELDVAVWYDEFTLKLGDGLRQKIDQGLASSKYGVVILSPDFFKKNWPKKELDGLFAKELQGNKVILPIWHNIDHDEIMKYSPMIADKLAVKSSDGVEVIITKILEVVHPQNS
ncbi:MAG: toll/interleukin-1 receptor domain-containing protein [Planctomycetota bacterium]